MSRIASSVLTKVNAPYARPIDATELALCAADFDRARAHIGPVFSFFTEVPAGDQKAFLEAFDVDSAHAREVARRLSALLGQELPLLR